MVFVESDLDSLPAEVRFFQNGFVSVPPLQGDVFMTLQLADLFPGQPDAKRALTGAAGLLAAVSESGVRSAVAETITVTTTQQYGPTPLSYDVLFTPIADATDLVSISAGSVYTGEGPSFTIQAIGSDDTTEDLFSESFIPDFFQTVSLASITNNTFTDFSAREIKGLRFTLAQPNPGPQPSLTLPVGTELVFTAVPEPAVAALLGCGLVAALIGRKLRNLRAAASAR